MPAQAAAGLVDLVRSGPTIEINPEATSLSDRVDVSIRGSASEATPRVLELIAEVQRSRCSSPTCRLKSDRERD